MIEVRTNALALKTPIDDLGFTVPGAGGSISLEGLEELRDASESNDLVSLATDEAFGPGLSTLELVFDGVTVDLAEVEQAIRSLAETIEDPVDEPAPLTFLINKGTGGIIHNDAGEILLFDDR